MPDGARDQHVQGFARFFGDLANKTSLLAGRASTFVIALTVVVVWAVSGPFFGYSDTWQLVINTGTTIVTFLMVFLIQRSQNKDALAIQVKLNELLASQEGASNQLINVEDWREDDIVALHKRFTKLSEQLSQVETECEAHSIAEAKEAVEDAEEALGDVRELVEHGKQLPRRDAPPKANGHSRGERT